MTRENISTLVGRRNFNYTNICVYRWSLCETGSVIEVLCWHLSQCHVAKSEGAKAGGDLGSILAKFLLNLYETF
jgi:hypothetical protein